MQRNSLNRNKEIHLILRWILICATRWNLPWNWERFVIIFAFFFDRLSKRNKIYVCVHFQRRVIFILCSLNLNVSKKNIHKHICDVIGTDFLSIVRSVYLTNVLHRVLHRFLPFFSSYIRTSPSVLFLTEINEQTTHMGEQIFKWMCCASVWLPKETRESRRNDGIHHDFSSHHFYFGFIVWYIKQDSFSYILLLLLLLSVPFCRSRYFIVISFFPSLSFVFTAFMTVISFYLIYFCRREIVYSTRIRANRCFMSLVSVY